MYKIPRSDINERTLVERWHDVAKEGRTRDVGLCLKRLKRKDTKAQNSYAIGCIPTKAVVHMATPCTKSLGGEREMGGCWFVWHGVFV